ncbi:transposase [Bdellovibrionota bacterium FG-2]
MKRYSDEFKRTAVQKLLSRGSRTIADITKETGIGSCSLYAWANRYPDAKGSGMKNADRRPQDWSPEEKLKAVIEFEGLALEKRGEFLRKAGLHSDHIASWKKSMQAGLASEGEAKISRAELSQLKAQKKELERDLHNKDKALASVTALLVLKKKADLLWGTGENE